MSFDPPFLPTQPFADEGGSHHEPADSVQSGNDLPELQMAAFWLAVVIVCSVLSFAFWVAGSLRVNYYFLFSALVTGVLLWLVKTAAVSLFSFMRRHWKL